MKHFKLISFLLFVTLLFSACGNEPAITVTSVPLKTQEPSVLPIEISKPSVVVSDSPQPASAGLFSGPYSGYTLPQSIPVISEADKKTFNPERTSDYLTTSLDANHEYTIRGAELKSGKLYLTVSDSVYFYSAYIASLYLKEVFSLSNEEILELPEFKDCYLDGESICNDGTFYCEERTLEPIPVADDAGMMLDELDANEADVKDFKNKFLKNKTRNDNIKTDIVSFDYSDGQITAIYSPEGVSTAGDDENDLSYHPPETVSPHSHGFGSLPKSLLGIKPVPTDNFDPDKTGDYLLADTRDIEVCYWVDNAELEHGKLYLHLTALVSIDADKAYKYLRKTFSLSDNDILKLPMFNYCALHKGKMYTPDEWNLKNGIKPDCYIAEYNYNSIDLEEFMLSEPVPVANNAKIILVGYGTLTRKQFANYLLGENGNISFNVWFKYSNGEITAITEQYVP